MRKVDDISRKIYITVFFVEFRGNGICLIRKEKLAVFNEYNLRRHYSTKHGEHLEKYKGDDRRKQAEQLH